MAGQLARQQGWIDLGGSLAVSAPSAVSRAPGRLTVFYRGANDHLWTVDWSATGGWGPHVDLGGVVLTSAPAAVSGDSLHVSVFYRGPNGRLWMSRWDGGRWWSAPEDLGGVSLTSAPTAISRGVRTLEVFYRGPNGHLWTSRWDGGRWWGAPTDLGGVALLSAPSAVAQSLGRTAVVYQGPNKHLWLSTSSGRASWDAPADLGGLDLTSDPVAAGSEDRRIDVFYLGPQQRVFRSAWSRDARWWSAPLDVGGAATSPPGAVALMADRRHLFVRGPNGALWHREVSISEDGASHDGDGDGVTDEFESLLLERFRPYYRFSYDHGSQERFLPTDALWYIRHSSVRSGDAGDDDVIVPLGGLAADPGLLMTLARPGTRWGSPNVVRNRGPTAYHLDVADECRQGFCRGSGSTWDDVRRHRNVGLYGHVVPVAGAYKVEYWQFYGFSSAFQPNNDYDHEGDWTGVNVLVDPASLRILSVTHLVHSASVTFARWTEAPERQGDILEFRAPGGYDGHLELSIAADVRKAQDRVLRLYCEPATAGNSGCTHPVVYIEYGAHESWPTEHWRWIGAPKHNGTGHRFLTATPPNLGEVGSPTGSQSAAAYIITHFNGRWGAYTGPGIDVTNPPGPPLQGGWSWPAR